jgi:hypothetical protein
LQCCAKSGHTDLYQCVSIFCRPKNMIAYFSAVAIGCTACPNHQSLQVDNLVPMLQAKASSKSTEKRGRHLLDFSSDEDHAECEGAPAEANCACAGTSALATTEGTGGKRPRKA